MSSVTYEEYPCHMSLYLCLASCHIRLKKTKNVSHVTCRLSGKPLSLCRILGTYRKGWDGGGDFGQAPPPPYVEGGGTFYTLYIKH